MLTFVTDRQLCGATISFHTTLMYFNRHVKLRALYKFFLQIIAFRRCSTGILNGPVINYHLKEMPQCPALLLILFFQHEVKYQHVVTFKMLLVTMKEIKR